MRQKLLVIMNWISSLHYVPELVLDSLHTLELIIYNSGIQENFQQQWKFLCALSHTVATIHV